MRTIAALLFCLITAQTQAATEPSLPFEVDYTITLMPQKDLALVEIKLGKAADLLKSLRFEVDPARFSAFTSATSKLQREKNQITWQPTGPGASLSYQVQVSRRRGKGAFDARMTPDWAIFRGERLIPAMTARMSKGATSRARLRFVLPKDWSNVDTGWTKLTDGRFAIDNPERHFDRPYGWMIAGNVGTRRDLLGTTEVAIGAPKGDPLNRMDAMTLINFVWPELESALGKTPRKILIVGAGDPMWRGGLSAPNSLFLHSARPLVSENATSTLVHELVHVVTRIRGKDRSDWISESIAEYYSVELIFRAGGMTPERHEKVFSWMKNWSSKVKTLRVDRSSAEVTARGLLLLRDLDQEIRRASDDHETLDDVVRLLRKKRVVSTQDLIDTAHTVLGRPSKVLASPLLK